MADLKTDYKDDVLDTTQNTKRKYRMVDNGDGTVSFEDVTEYLQQGDSFGADDTNATNTKVNALQSDIDETNTKVNALETDIGEINDNLTALETRIAKVTVSESTSIALTPNTEYVTLADGYFIIICNSGTNTYVDGYVNGSGIIRTTVSPSPGYSSGMNGIYVKKGSTIKCILSSTGAGGGWFYPLS